MSVRKAAELYNVQRSTLADRASGRYGMSVVHGRPTAIPKEVESKIVECVKTAADRGIGITRKQLLLKTNVLCQRIKVHSSYENFKAGKNWWEGLKRRHGLTLRQPERLGTTRCRMMNREVVDKYFNSLSSTVSALNLNDKQALIWNCDETGKNFEHNPVKVVAGIGVKSVSGRTSNKSTNITIMACVNAAGSAMPPMFVVKGKTSRSLHSFNTTAAPAGTIWSYQEKGWMTDKIGEEWFDNIFLQNCGPQRPQLLILDGHSSHESLAILQRAIEENIYILALPPHTTHHLQPLDKSVFGPFNKAYNAACSEFLQNPINSVNKWNFPVLISRAWASSFTEGNIKSGFAACGIYPLNRKAISDQAFAPSKLSEKPLDSQMHSSTEQSSVSSYTSTSTSSATITASNSRSFCLKPVQHFTQNVDADNVSLESDVSENVQMRHLPLTNHDDTAVDVITDSSVVLDLLSSGDFVIDGELDLQFDLNDNLTTPLTTESSTSASECSMNVTFNSTQAPEISESPVPTANWNHHIDSIFLPPSNHTAPVKQKRKSITSHRLLTSDEVIQEKLALERKKQEKLNKRTKRIKTEKV